MIPSKFSQHDLVQKAALSNPNQYPPFHMNLPENGFNIDPSRHLGNHGLYSDKIEAALDQWHLANQSATAQEAAEALASWQVQLRQLLTNTTGNINNLTIPPI